MGYRYHELVTVTVVTVLGGDRHVRGGNNEMVVNGGCQNRQQRREVATVTTRTVVGNVRW